MSKVDKKISIITVTYNSVEFIESTLLSVSNQKSNLIEHIVIDGSSTDGTVDVINKYKDQLAFYISEPDCGIYDAMNKGVKVARGEWVLFLNAGDVFYDEDTISKLSWNWPCGSEFIFFSYQIKGEDIEIKPDLNMRFGMPTSHQAMLVATNALKQSEFKINLKVASDYEFFIRRNITNEKSGFIENSVLTKVLPGGFSEINLNNLKGEYFRIIFKYFGLKKAIIYYMWSNRIVFFLIKKITPRLLFEKLKVSL